MTDSRFVGVETGSLAIALAVGMVLEKVFIRAHPQVASKASANRAAARSGAVETAPT